MICFGIKDARAGSGGWGDVCGRKHIREREGLPDKKGAVGSAHVVGWIEEFRPKGTWASQPFFEKRECIQRKERHRSLYISAGR